MDNNKLEIVFLSSEAVPFAKTGGLGDICGVLTKKLAGLGHKVSLIMPKYRQIKDSEYDLKYLYSIKINIRGIPYVTRIYRLDHEGVEFIFVDYPQFYDRKGLYSGIDGNGYSDNLIRFVLFDRVAHILLMNREKAPDVVHCNDWPTALMPLYLRHEAYSGDFFNETAIIFSIHNFAYQGVFVSSDWRILNLESFYLSPEYLEYYSDINLTKSAIIFSDAISTVSESYASEILTPEWGFGLDGLLATREEGVYGIINGVDYGEWNPKCDKYLYDLNYDINDISNKYKIKEEFQKELGLEVNKDIPLFGMVTRLAKQKGIELIIDNQEELSKLPIQMVLLGTGEKWYVEKLSKLAESKKIVFLNEFSNELAHKIEAASDIYLMPSEYEPCGLNQLYSLKYGTVPIVRAIGGLKDTIRDNETGFVFIDFSSEQLLMTIKKAIKKYKDKKAWNKMIKSCMSEDWSWEGPYNPVQKYLDLYKKIKLQKMSE